MHITTATSISAYMDLLATRSVQAVGSAEAKSNESLYLAICNEDEHLLYSFVTYSAI